MSTWETRAQDAAVVDRHALYDEGIDGVFFGGFGNASDAQDFGFRYGASWQREALLSDESVERAGRSLFYGDIDPDLDVSWATAHEGVRTEYLAMARVALTAAMGDDDE